MQCIRTLHSPKCMQTACIAACRWAAAAVSSSAWDRHMVRKPAVFSCHYSAPKAGPHLLQWSCHIPATAQGFVRFGRPSAVVLQTAVFLIHNVRPGGCGPMALSERGSSVLRSAPHSCGRWSVAKRMLVQAQADLWPSTSLTLALLCASVRVCVLGHWVALGGGGTRSIGNGDRAMSLSRGRTAVKPRQRDRDQGNSKVGLWDCRGGGGGHSRFVAAAKGRVEARLSLSGRLILYPGGGGGEAINKFLHQQSASKFQLLSQVSFFRVPFPPEETISRKLFLVRWGG